MANTINLANDITIDYLANHKELVPAVARYSYDEWRPIYDRAALNYDHVVKSYSNRVNIESLPLSMVILHKGKLIGIGSLKINDLDIRPQLTPWLGGMYVEKAYRGQGAGTVLVKQLIKEAERLQCQDLYLWTYTAESLYAQLGWSTIEHLEYCDYNIAVMHRDI